MRQAVVRVAALFAGIVVALSLVAPPASGQQFPARDITFIVPFSPGGGYDVWARALGRAMEKEVPKDVRVVVKNVLGAGGRVGSLQLYRSRPDGYTIGTMDVAGLVPYQVAVGTEKAGYDLARFAWVAAYAEAPWTIAVRKASPLRSLKDVKEQGARLRWGVLGPGETHWLAALITTGEMGIPLHLVTGYKGAAELAPALIRGDFDLCPLLSTTALEYVKSGDVRPIAVLAEQRFPAYPEAPTAREQGFPISVPFVRVVAAPPGTPAEVVQVLEGLILKAIKDPELRKWAESTGRGLEIVRPGGADATRKSIQELLAITQKYEKEIAAAIKVGQ